MSSVDHTGVNVSKIAAGWKPQRWTSRMLAILVLLATVALTTDTSTAAAQNPSRPFQVGDVLAYLGLDESARQALLAGEIVSTPIPEGSDTELALAVAMLFPRSLEEAVADVRSGATLRADRNLIDFNEITGWPPLEADFAGIEFKAEEDPEVRAILGFEGGATFNLAPAEIERLRELRAKYGAGKSGEDGAKARTAVASFYRSALLERYRAYREMGLAGIAPYDRGGGKVVEPAKKLRLAAGAAKFFEKNEPEVYQAFVTFPKTDSSDAEHRFYWLKQNVQDRPDFVLSHRMLVVRPGYAALAERQYYIGHSYNAVQIVSGALPVEQGIVVFYTSRTSIDQLAGMTGRIARPIASRRLIERVSQRFEALRSRTR